MNDPVEMLNIYLQLWEEEGWPSSAKFRQSLVDNIRAVLERLEAAEKDIAESRRVAGIKGTATHDHNRRLLVEQIKRIDGEAERLRARIEAAVSLLKGIVAVLEGSHDMSGAIPHRIPEGTESEDHSHTDDGGRGVTEQGASRPTLKGKP